MTWNQGTMFTDHYTKPNKYAQEFIMSTDRVDNIHIDAGKRDWDRGGVLAQNTGGSPCSDGPDWCGTIDGAC
jgi:hypothetical protein